MHLPNIFKAKSTYHFAQQNHELHKIVYDQHLFAAMSIRDFARVYVLPTTIVELIEKSFDCSMKLSSQMMPVSKGELE
ncbi:MAG: hypothetical protein CMP84_02605 [Gammaproteobacteria bacterium]|jgi:hypothetical protein|nr:hypothetical protein [Gammaproteobacteria bacterium]|tara:strand:- start:403 stop:636 length:234 start_codon:yes stop_codon:yes gene_type:complete